MKKASINPLKLLTLALLTLTACSTPPPPEPTGSGMKSSIYEEGVPGGTMIKTFTITATVTTIDAPNRRVTLTSPNGAISHVKCGPEVVNFNHIRVGDQVKVTASEETIVSLTSSTGPAPGSVGDAALAALAANSAKPDAAAPKTTHVTAKIVALDRPNHRILLALPDGTMQMLPVRNDVNLATHQLGERVVISRTEAIAIRIETP